MENISVRLCWRRLCWDEVTSASRCQQRSSNTQTFVRERLGLHCLTCLVVMNTPQGKVRLFICKYHFIYIKYQFYCQIVLTYSSFEYMATSLVICLKLKSYSWLVFYRQVFESSDSTYLNLSCNIFIISHLFNYSILLEFTGLE